MTLVEMYTVFLDVHPITTEKETILKSIIICSYSISIKLRLKFLKQVQQFCFYLYV